MRTLSAAEPKKATTQLAANNPTQGNKALTYFDKFTRGAANLITRKNDTNTSTAETSQPAKEIQVAKNNAVDADATPAQAMQPKKLAFSSYFDNYTRKG